MKKSITIIAVAGLAFAAFCVDRCSETVKEPGNLVRDIIEKVNTVNAEEKITVHVNFPQEVLKIATVEVTQKVSFQYETTYLGSKKTIYLEQDYAAGYGIAANSNLTLYKDYQNVVHLCNLPVSVLYCSPAGDCVIVEDDGIWNKIGDQDRVAAQSALRREALKVAQQNELAKRNARDRILRLFNEQSDGVRFHLD